MKKILLSLSCHVWPLIGMLATAGAEQKPVDAVTAEVWNFDIPAGVSAKSVFEQWRAQVPPEDSIRLPIDGLTIPAREGSTMV
ncbi:MAG TPA: hypothetical protein VLO11_13050, partial [Luteolibacter sp.]|nr:hypothetical protein [Luteolibacter sp.]